MKYFLRLSRENLILAREEVISLMKTKKFKLIDNFLIIDEKINFDLLAYTFEVYKFVFYSDKLNIDWNEIIKGSYKVEGENAIKYADIIWNKLKKPKVNMKKPKNQIQFFKIGGKILCGILLKEIKNNFEERKAHRKPGYYPMSLNPKLARAMINLSRGNIILDPFCGAGTILVEAGLMNKKIIGNDVSEKMIKLSKINLKYYKIKDYNLHNYDALKLKLKVDAIVTDPPYGKGSYATINAEELLGRFLKIAGKMLIEKGRIVFTFNKPVKIPKEFKLVRKFKIYIHKSMNKYIYTLEKWK